MRAGRLGGLSCLEEPKLGGDMWNLDFGKDAKEKSLLIGGEGRPGRREDGMVSPDDEEVKNVWRARGRAVCYRRRYRSRRDE